MRAFHVNSTSPSVPLGGRYRSANEYYIEDFEILTTILSALKWRQYNGSIKMYTDYRGKAYYDELGISDIWDEGIDVDVLENLKLNINPDVFWAFGRLLALSQETSPCVLMDTDLIVWNKISHLISADLMAIHSEPLEFYVYVPQEYLRIPPQYVWEEWDWTVTPCNAALLYFGDDRLRAYFAEKALIFMDNNPAKKKEEMPIHAVFVEQRLLPMCAKKLGVDVKCFLDGFQGTKLADGTENNLFSHLWLYKSILKKDKFRRKDICLRCLNRILVDFPEYESRLANIPSIRPYMSSLGKA